jgi:hypothetical protein
MFASPVDTVDHALERVRAACWSELGEIAAQEARLKHRAMELARQANARGDWKAAGFSSHEAWYAQACRTDHRTAKLVTETSEALGELPHLDEAVSTGALTLDQAAAAAPFATPETDAELARVAPGKAPSEIARAARTLAPPKVADDQELYQRRKLSMAWTNGHRELVISGRLPLEQGTAFEQAIWSIAKQRRAADKKAGETLEWQHYAADALVTLARRDGGGVGKRCQTTLIVHVAENEPAVIEGSGAISDETAEHLTCTARRLTIRREGRDLVHSRMGRDASWAQERALFKRSPHCQYPGCTATHELEAHHVVPWARGGKTELSNLILLCPRHHKRLHDHHIRTSSSGEKPVFTDPSGRLITANRPHAPPS